MTTDHLATADRTEEKAAAKSLREARTSSELIAAWAMNCEHFRGEARVRLQVVYSAQLRKQGAFVG